MQKYEPKIVEEKWQKIWEEQKAFKANDKDKKPKYYALVEFPYPSGEGLHCGHPRSYTALDVVARKRRMQGYNVLYPMGFDAFGLPAENYAIKTKSNPKDVVKKNIENFTRQMKSIGFSFDWDRVVNTTEPEYYKWTQWIFLKLFEKGLAYQKQMPINWCPKCKIGLANEEAIDGKCERCGTEVEKKDMKQWMLAITKYADRLIDDLDDLDYLEKIKLQQKNWIGRSEGTIAKFKIKTQQSAESQKPKAKSSLIEIFTTRIDTIFGVTYIVLAPEHELVRQITTPEHQKEVDKYIKQTNSKTDIQRKDLEKEKTGVFTGSYAINPVNNKEVPIWIADYVVASYGSGAVMAVPAHDERDYAFAKKYNLPIEYVIEPVTGKPREKEEYRKSVVVVVENPKNGKVLTFNWGKELGGYLILGGGMETNEDPIEAAKREILEETGYKNVEFVAKSETIHHHYRAHSKNVNRYIDAVGLHFRLKDESKENTKLEDSEKGKFKLEWKEKNEVANLIEDELHHYVFARFILGNAFTGDGILIGSEDFSGMDSEKAREEITKWLNKKNLGDKKVEYSLRDWVFSRQHYWGEPIPIIHCKKCGIVPVPEKELPIELPFVENYEPTNTGESPLAKITDWVNTTCPKCGAKAKRETDTMPNWAGSSWYFIRYIDPKNDKEIADKKKLKHWLPIDWYNGGMEHTTLHLLYSRFWYKFLYDIGVVPTKEPYQKRTSHGMILAEDGQKMSKSRGNVINPDDIIEKFGADTLRMYEMFMGPFSEAVAWNTDSIKGVRKFLDRVWNNFSELPGKESDKEIEVKLHQTIKKITEDIEAMRFNTCISALMELLNFIENKPTTKEQAEIFTKLLYPFAPHISEELWEKLGHTQTITNEAWPIFDESKIKTSTVKIGVQIMGKVRGTIELSQEATEKEAVKLAKENPNIQKHLRDKKIIKTIYVPGKILNFVAK